MFFVYLALAFTSILVKALLVPELAKIWSGGRVAALRWLVTYAAAVGVIGIIGDLFVNMDVTFTVDQDGMFFGYESGDPLPFLFVLAAAAPMALVVGLMERTFRKKNQVDGDAGTGSIQPA